MKLLLLSTVAVSATATDFGLTPSLVATIDRNLDSECGDSCRSYWNALKEANSEDGSNALGSSLTHELERTTARLNGLESSFLKDGVDDVCTKGRLGAMATYQSLNIGVHTLGVVTKAVCACLDVYTESVCLLRKAAPIPCEQISNVYGQTLAASNGAWQAVKATTATCKVVGDARAQVSLLKKARNPVSFLKSKSQSQRPVLNIHVADTRGSFLRGDMNRHTLSQLIQEANTPGAKEKMNISMLIPAAARFAKKESTSDYDRDLAGSLITLLTGKPIVFQSSDAESGSYGHTNIVVPSPARIYG